MLRLAVIVFLVSSVFLLNKYKMQILSDNKLPQLREQNLKSVDPCLSKNKCAVVYLAPWCPGCEQISPYLQSFIAKANSTNSNNGFLVIIGAGTPATNADKAASFSSNAIVDDDQILAHSLGIAHYPSFMVINSERKIELRDQEAMNWINQQWGRL